jgi:hypothetical protein
MQVARQRKIKNGEEFDALFPRPLFLDPTIKKGATVNDTVRFIPKVVQETLFQTSKIAALLKGKTVYETCKNIWDFVYNHIAYKKDEEGKEQIRSPARAWHDRFNGVDCDCYTVFISSILSNLKIKHKLRITKYKEDFFQHIYPIVPTAEGNYITVDCVVDRFNYEEPYSEKKDTNMDLEYLNGVPNTNNVDVQDLMGWEELNGDDNLGKIKLFKKMSQPPGSEGDTSKKGKLKNLIHKGLHITNRLNPATALLREGVLISMKLNLFKVAQRLKFTYLTEEQVKQKGAEVGNFQKLKSVREKLEKIFYDAGGKPENLKKAILTGKGNKNHEVSGLGYILDNMDGMDETTPTPVLLGNDMYHDENLHELRSLGSLVAAGAAVTAATGVIGTIAGLIKKIGNIFPKGKSGSDDFENVDSKPGDGTSAEEVTKGAADIKIVNSDDGSAKNTSNDSGGDKTGSFWEKNKNWIKPTAIGITGLGLVYLGFKMMKPKQTVVPATPQLTGLKTKNKKGGNGKKKVEVVYL